MNEPKPRCPFCSQEMHRREVPGDVQAWWCASCNDGFAADELAAPGPHDHLDLSQRPL